MLGGSARLADVARAVDALAQLGLAVVADVARAVHIDVELVRGAHVGVARATDGDLRLECGQAGEIGAARPVEFDRLRGRRCRRRVTSAEPSESDLERVGGDAVGMGRCPSRTTSMPVRLATVASTTTSLLAEAVVVERDLQRAVAHVGLDVVDHLLAGS